MTRIYDNSGKVVPVSVIEAGPVYITHKSDNKIQIGFAQDRHFKKPQLGQLKKAGINAPLKYFKEITLDDEEKASFKEGQEIDVTLFKPGDVIDVSGVSKGKGFAGVIKRHGFHRGPTTHGSDHHRAPGSIGSTYPQRVIKGKKLPGHLGATKITVKKLKVVDIMPDKNLLIISGAVPGRKGTLLTIKGASNA